MASLNHVLSGCWRTMIQSAECMWRLFLFLHVARLFLLTTGQWSVLYTLLESTFLEYQFMKCPKWANNFFLWQNKLFSTDRPHHGRYVIAQRTVEDINKQYNLYIFKVLVIWKLTSGTCTALQAVCSRCSWKKWDILHKNNNINEIMNKFFSDNKLFVQNVYKRYTNAYFDY